MDARAHAHAHTHTHTDMGARTQTDRQTGDLISILSFLESKLKETYVANKAVIFGMKINLTQITVDVAGFAVSSWKCDSQRNS